MVHLHEERVVTPNTRQLHEPGVETGPLEALGQLSLLMQRKEDVRLYTDNQHPLQVEPREARFERRMARARRSD